MDKTDAQATWQVIADAIDEIYNRNASQLSFEELYRKAYNLTLHKHGDLLYDGLQEKLRAHLQSVVEQLVATPTSSMLESMAQVWNEHSITMIMIRDILMYMDRTYVVKERLRPVYELGLHLFRLTVWEHPQIHSRIRELLLQAIAQERAGLLTDDRDPLKKVIGMLLELSQADFTANVYQEWEEVFLQTTLEFYNAESLQFLSQNTASDFVRKATERLAEEKERAQALALPATTQGPLMTIVQTEWIERHAQALVEMEHSGFAALLQDDSKLDSMRDMYDLFERVPSSVDALRDALGNRIKTDGRKLIADQEKGLADPAAFVRGVLAMKERFDRIVTISFRGDSKAQKCMRKSFEDFLNCDARAASCLAVYVDELLRAGLRGATDEQVSAALEECITVFRYLSDKDVFESFYKQNLAKRLLGGRSVSDDAERAMVSLLKAECGYQFTTKLEGMFNDMRISRETREEYKTHRLEQQHSGESSSHKKSVDIEVDVLTAGYWPSQNVPSCSLPPEITGAIDRFSKFYLGKHTGRKLQWQTSAGSAEVRATFGTPENPRRHELCVSTYQMCILVLFNDHDTMTFGEIRSQTQVPDSELRRHLISLCTPKNRILKKGSKGKGITSDSDTFTYNHEYTSKLKRVRIPLVKETSMGNPSAAGGGPDAARVAGGDAAVPVSVEEDRRHLIEAAIVRIMKARKSLHHNDLIAEVTRQMSVRFQPAPQTIKKRIESLIDREYLERSAEEHRLYKYVA